MKLLEERIRKDGIVKPGNVLKVDSTRGKCPEGGQLFKSSDGYRTVFRDGKRI